MIKQKNKLFKNFLIIAIIFVLLVILSFCLYLFSKQNTKAIPWEFVGKEKTSRDAPYNVGLYVENNILYRVYSYGGDAGVIVEKFESGNWRTVNDLVNNSKWDNVEIHINDNIPYAFFDAATYEDGPHTKLKENKIWVKKFENDDWKDVGSQYVNKQQLCGNLSFFISDNTPYFACDPTEYFYDKSDHSKNPQKGIVFKKFKDGEWQNAAGSDYVVIDWGSLDSIAVDGNNLYLAYSVDSDPLNPNLSTQQFFVKKFENGNWTIIGNFALSGPIGVDLRFIDNILYAQYSDATGFIAKKFENGRWQNVGGYIGSSDKFGPDAPFLSVDKNGIYIAYVTDDTSRFIVKKLENNAWKDLYVLDMNPLFQTSPLVAFINNGNINYIATCDALPIKLDIANIDMPRQCKITVRKFSN